MSTIKIKSIRGTKGDKEFIQVEAMLDEQRLQLTQYIYEEIDKAILQNMPIETLEAIFRTTSAELERRRG